MATLEQRVARLEVENRRLKMACLVGALGAVALVLGAAQPKPTRIKADIIEAGTILVDVVKANTVDSAKVLAGDLSLYDDVGSTSLKVTNTGDGPTLAFTNEGTRPSVQLEIPQGSPAREITRSAAPPAAPAASAPVSDAEMQARRERLSQLETDRERLSRENADQKQLVDRARENLKAAQDARQDPTRIAVLQRVLQVYELSLADNEAALKGVTSEIEKLSR